MGNWYCKCGNRMSDGLSPTPHGYELYTSKQCCDGNLDERRPFADVYICPECGGVMVFGRDSNRYMFYEPESVDVYTGNIAEADNVSKYEKSFSDEAWEAYSTLSEKEDADSKKTVNDINELIQELQDKGTMELSVRNKLVGPEHQICYRVHEYIIEIISIEWIFE